MTQFPDAVDHAAIAALIEFCREGQKAQALQRGGEGEGGAGGGGGGGEGEDKAPPAGL